MNKNNVWFITTKTNLHVGNENTSSYGLIDLAVQRNATTDLPCINSSSLKGALNEFAANGAKLDSEKLVKIFGSDKVKKDGKPRSSDTQKGQYVFFDANILFIPQQSDDKPYELVTCEEVLNQFVLQVKLLTGEDVKKDEINAKFGCTRVVSCKEFKEMCSNDNLPIIARNYVENGESKNLWYEQVVPAETVFYTFIDDKDDATLSTKLIKEGNLVQIGANATIGYGYCVFTNLK